VKKRAHESINESQAFKKARRLGLVGVGSATEKVQKNTMLSFVRTGQTSLSHASGPIAQDSGDYSTRYVLTNDT
jgi:hypothetical protein